MTPALLRLCACLTLLSVGACAHPQPLHRGLSTDGYSTTTNSPHLPPPADLMQPAHH